MEKILLYLQRDLKYICKMNTKKGKTLRIKSPLKVK